MHIVQLLPELNQGGVERGTIEFSRELVRRGHESTIISAGGKLAAQLERDGGRHISMDVCSKNPLTFFPRVRKLQTIISQLQPDILHARSRVPAWLTWFANKRLRIPFVTTVHGFNSVGKYSEIMTRGDAVICVSNPLKEFIEAHYGTPAEKITVVHRGIDPQEFDPSNVDREWMASFRKEYGLAGKYVVTAVGRITELKDYETLICAIADCAKDIPNILGLIVGGVRHDKQEYFERLQNLVKKLGIEDRIMFAGSHSYMPEIYALSDVLVSCSKKPESFGRTLIEAMAMNTPVIATRHGGALDIIIEGKNGLLFKPGDASELSSSILKINTIPKMVLRDYVLMNFSLRNMVEKTITLYEKLR